MVFPRVDDQSLGEKAIQRILDNNRMSAGLYEAQPDPKQLILNIISCRPLRPVQHLGVLGTGHSLFYSIDQGGTQILQLII